MAKYIILVLTMCMWLRGVLGDCLSQTEGDTHICRCEAIMNNENATCPQTE